MGKKKKPAASTTPARTALAADATQGTYAVSLSAVGAPARLLITLPHGGFVTPGEDLIVSVNTTRTDLSYIVRLTDLTAATATDKPAGPPPAADFNVFFDGALLVDDHDYEILAMVDPAVGTSPPHRTAFKDINTHTPV